MDAMDWEALALILSVLGPRTQSIRGRATANTLFICSARCRRNRNEDAHVDRLTRLAESARVSPSQAASPDPVPAVLQAGKK